MYGNGVMTGMMIMIQNLRQIQKDRRQAPEKLTVEEAGTEVFIIAEVLTGFQIILTHAAEISGSGLYRDKDRILFLLP